MSDQHIVITGAAGRIGTMLRSRLARDSRRLRLLDVRRTGDIAPEHEDFVDVSIEDQSALIDAFDGADAVVHLGGQSREAPAEEVLRLNALGTYHVLEAAKRTGITRVVLASSNHAAGFYDRRDVTGGVPADAPGRPDTLYGWSKVAVESVGRLYADRYGMDVICLRIGMCFETPPGPRGLALWMSPDDCARLVEACLAVERPGFRIVWGVSRNTRAWTSHAEGEAIGFFAKDDSEVFAPELLAEHGEPDADDPLMTRIGGQWCDIPLGVRN